MLAATADHEYWRLGGLGQINGVDGFVIFALVVGLRLVPHLFDNVQGLFQLADTLAGAGEVITVGQILVHFPACTDTQNQAALGEVLDGAGHLGGHGRIAITLPQHHGAPVQRRRERGIKRQGGERFETVVIAPLQMIGHPGRIPLSGNEIKGAANTGIPTLAGFMALGTGFHPFVSPLVVSIGDEVVFRFV